MNAALESEWRDVPQVDGESPLAPEPIIAKRLCDLERDPEHDPNELLRHRFLCRGGGALFCGPTGIGKSAMAMQFMLSWSLGRDCFGISPQTPIRSLIIQAENDDNDMAEMRDGVITGLGLTPGQAKTATEAVIVVREDRRTSVRFFQEVCRPTLTEHRPDLLWIDPAFSFLGGESNAQADVSAFLRNGLNPLLREFNCGGIVVHHVNKPPSGREKPDWAGSDFAYLGSGSAEWGNWARAVLALRSVGSHSVFELRAGKRGGRLRWRDDAGEPTFARQIAHSNQPGVICWRDAKSDEVVKVGRPKSSTMDDDILALLPKSGLLTSQWLETAKVEVGISPRSFHRCKSALVKADRVHKSSTSDRWQPVLNSSKCQ